MTLITSWEAIPILSFPTALTIGNFDGVHVGHQMLLAHLKSKGLPTVVFTFSNHPSELFTPHSPIPQIYPPEEKARLLLAQGIDYVIMIPFTRAFAETSFEDFLAFLQARLHFSHLILGAGSSFGKARGGTQERVIDYAKSHGFSVEYLSKKNYEGHPVSSGRIRAAIQAGQWEEVDACLGRRYTYSK